MNLRSAKIWLLGFILGAGAVGCGDDPARPDRTEGEAGAGGAGECRARSCEELDASCGSVDDGCGQSIDCGPPCSAGAGGGGGAAGAAAIVDCEDEVLTTVARNGRRGRSLGFSGSDESYVEIFDVQCEEPATCIEACAERGGREDMCDAAECLPTAEAGSACLPPPIWGSLESIQTEDDSLLDMSQLILVDTPYHDTLVVDDFGLAVPPTATIIGIVVEVRRAGDESVVDESLRLWTSDEAIGTEHGLQETWGAEPTWVAYGGPEDTWGEELTPARVNDEGFGVALSVDYTAQAGNTRAYVDAVRIAVSYTLCD